MGRSVRPLIVLALMIGLDSWGQDAPRPLEITDVRLGLAGAVKPGHWTPVAIDIAARGAEFRGIVSLVAPDSEGVSVSMGSVGTVVPRDSQVTVRGLFRQEHPHPNLSIELRDADGQRVLSVNTESLESVRIESVPSSSLLAVGIGSPAGLQQIAAPPTDSEPDQTLRTVDQQVAMLDRLDDLPIEWFAYQPAEVLVIATDKQEVLDAIDGARADAITTWVRQGGHLVISVANRWQNVKESPLGKLLPADIVGVRTVGRLSPEVRSLESLAGDKASLDVPAAGMSLASLGESRGWSLPSTPGGSDAGSVVVRGLFGFGTVTLLAFDVNAPPFRDWNQGGKFWLNLLEIPTKTNEEPTTFWSGSAQVEPDIALWIDHLLQVFPSVTLVPFSWVALLMAGYILLIGPIDYFFLKRIVGKLEWTWFTFPLLVILVSGAAYVAANRLKGDRLLLNRFELVDIDQPSQTLRGQSFFSIFSPKMDRYTLTSEPALGADGSWADLTGSRASSDRATSTTGQLAAERNWQGMPATNIFGGDTYGYLSQDHSTVLYVPIPVWSVKSFQSQWLSRGKIAIENDLAVGTINDSTMLVGSLTNRLGIALEKPILLFGDYAYELGDLGVDQSATITSPLQKTLSVVRSAYADKLLLPPGTYRSGQEALSPEELASRTDSQQRTAFLLGLTLAPREGAPDGTSLGNNVLDQWNLRSHLRAGRAVLLAQVSAPGCRLWINEEPKEGQDPTPPVGDVRQITLVRVILDPKPAGASAP